MSSSFSALSSVSATPQWQGRPPSSTTTWQFPEAFFQTPGVRVLRRLVHMQGLRRHSYEASVQTKKASHQIVRSCTVMNERENFISSFYETSWQVSGTTNHHHHLYPGFEKHAPAHWPLQGCTGFQPEALDAFPSSPGPVEFLFPSQRLLFPTRACTIGDVRGGEVRFPAEHRPRELRPRPCSGDKFGRNEAGMHAVCILHRFEYVLRRQDIGFPTVSRCQAYP